MVILDLKLKNILAFDDFHICFSYPRKLGKSLLENENLSSVPSFRYKKLNIIVGSNATGKTSLFRIIVSVLRFLATGEKRFIECLLRSNKEEGSIQIDFVSKEEKEPKYFLHRVNIKTNTDSNSELTILISHKLLSIKSPDSYEKLVTSLDSMAGQYNDYRVYFARKENFGFSDIKMALPATEPSFDRFTFIHGLDSEDKKDYLSILNSILKTLDPSIKEVAPSKDSDNAYVLSYEDGEKIIVQEGNTLSDIPLLSSGTKYGFNLANMVYAIKHHLNSIYLVDEQFAYISSDIEVALLGTMVELLGDDEQLFFTTHNSNILSMGFPFHSFYFLRKVKIGEKREIQVSCASELENRNNISPYNMYENDMFASAPDLSLIYSIK